MESRNGRKDSDDEREALAVADQALRRLTAGLRLPAGLYLMLAAAVAVQLATAAWGVAAQTVAGVVVALAGMAVFLGVAMLMLHRFRRINGVTLDGLVSQIVLAAGASASVVYLAAFAAGVWAAFASLWWLVAVAAVAGGTGCALGARHWWSAYQRDPAAHARGASPRLLGALAVLAFLGFAGLVVFG
jgi:FtsH-binding integral membrane protein